MGLQYDSVTLALNQYISGKLDLDPTQSLEFTRLYCDQRRICNQRHLVHLDAAVRLNPHSNAFTRVRIETQHHDWFERMCADLKCRDFVAMPSGRSIKHMSKMEIAAAPDITAVPHNTVATRDLFTMSASEYEPTPVRSNRYSPEQDKARRDFVTKHLSSVASHVGTLMAEADDFESVRTLLRGDRVHATVERALHTALSTVSTTHESAAICAIARDVVQRVRRVAVAHKAQIKTYKDIRERLNKPVEAAPVRQRYNDGFSDDEGDDDDGDYSSDEEMDKMNKMGKMNRMEEMGTMSSPMVVTQQERQHLAGEASFYASKFSDALGKAHSLIKAIGHYYLVVGPDGRVYEIKDNSPHASTTANRVRPDGNDNDERRRTPSPPLRRPGDMGMSNETTTTTSSSPTTSDDNMRSSMFMMNKETYAKKRMGGDVDDEEDMQQAQDATYGRYGEDYDYDRARLRKEMAFRPYMPQQQDGSQIQEGPQEIGVKDEKEQNEPKERKDEKEEQQDQPSAQFPEPRRGRPISQYSTMPKLLDSDATGPKKITSATKSTRSTVAQYRAPKQMPGLIDASIQTPPVQKQAKKMPTRAKSMIMTMINKKEKKSPSPRILPIDETLVLTGTRQNEAIKATVGEHGPALDFCLANLPAGGSDMPTIYDLTRYQGNKTTLTQMQVVHDDVLYDDIANGKTSMVAIEAESRDTATSVYFVV